jgi:type VI secretion system protein ImpJ
MSRYRKVVWNEGMLLTPQHFQQADNYQEELVNSRLSAMTPYEWGVIDLQINRESIANGVFEIVRCRAVMPDGLTVNVPETDPAPDPRPIETNFAQGTDKLDVHLAVPAKRIGAINYRVNGGDHDLLTRYLLDAGVAIDEVTGENEQQLAFARSNLRLVFANELSDGYSSIKIAELIRTATGQIKAAESYVPPSLNVTASPWLVNMLRQLVEILITKSSTLGEKLRDRNLALVDFTSAEVAIFWLLHTVNSSIPILAHLFRTRVVHPERLYFELARLQGALMTFVRNQHPKDIARYEHTDLRATFSRLANEIRELLELVYQTRCVPIPLERRSQTQYFARVPDDPDYPADRLLKDAQFYLGLQANTPDARLIERVPLVVKIAAPDEINFVVAQAMPGVPMRHVSPPPAAIPSRVRFDYFSLDRVNPFWDVISGAKNISLYVPDEFPEVKLEMYAVKP